MNDIAKVLSHETNYAVVQLPGRRFPGMVLQGDTLSGLACTIEQASELLQRGEIGELKDVLEELRNEFRDRMAWYERVLAGAGIALPYSKRTGTNGD